MLRQAHNRSMPVRQLSDMMRKRGLLDAAPEEACSVLRASFLAEEHRGYASGRRPRVTHVGRDRFALTELPSDAIAAAEASLASVVESTRKVVRERMKAFLSELPLPSLERVAHLYLEERGYADVRWVKRAGKSAYATAMAPWGLVLVGVRTGSVEVDRRGIGELRVGLRAKKIGAALFLAPQDLGDDAREELEKDGGPVQLIVGDAWVNDLIRAGIGAHEVAVRVPFLDTELLADLRRG
jgi:hypothetical protein